MYPKIFTTNWDKMTSIIAPILLVIFGANLT
jgi:hypothetical protein